MKPPICKLCGKAHWTYEDHYTGTSAITPGYVKDMARGAMGKVMPADSARGIPRDVPTIKRTEPLNGRDKRTRGRPRKWASEAERKRAYRKRSTG